MTATAEHETKCRVPCEDEPCVTAQVAHVACGRGLGM